jgi:hypothetical protein
VDETEEQLDHCCNVIEDSQRWPHSGPLASNLDLSLLQFRGEIEHLPVKRIYGYVLTTLRLVDGQFEQRGSAPNFQGGLVTLFTCKHHLRTWEHLPDDFKGCWIAGFSGSTVGPRNALFYLMRVEHAFESFFKAWNSLGHRVREAKATNKHVLGDLYRPKKNAHKDIELDAKAYYKPHRKHVHIKGWCKDIEMTGAGERSPALLAGEPRYSYIWTRPRLYLTLDHPRTQKTYWPNLNNLLDSLEER